ncbi:HsdR family type I site-specific deoxyribonuclease [Altererythrobacter confluentis]|uniref:Type I restriction enzyme endonuclease subunit n=1 Tax=Allopontixanthobacter confluentis TaxID=1849021 RepID=A0A6L7GER3_9SPHN|nr:type I restriction endonuclease subunit R [Allopontixanthobacter confluentis]MXP14513.1 HsdR family type I site-specific deoxyribonuclease [Allopontixanthobacter confluentis]
MGTLTESIIEDAALEWLGELGWQVAYGAQVSPDGSAPIRMSNGDVILEERLRSAIATLNPGIPQDARDEALRRVLASETPSLIEENRRLHRLMIEGVPVEFYDGDSVRGDRVKLVDFCLTHDTAGLGQSAFDRNDWLAVNQFIVIEDGRTRRPDVVLFLNGLPIGVIELKSPADENATLHGAFNQLQTYKAQIPALFRSNAILITSDGIKARVGSLTADEERFMPWRSTDGHTIAAVTDPQLETVLKGVCDRAAVLRLLRDFTVFGDTKRGIIKIIAGYHQYFAAQNALAATLRALPFAHSAKATAAAVSEHPSNFDLPSAEAHRPGDKRIGVVWHTQGSGKSLLMAFYAGLLVREEALENPTIVIITDRNDLDEQLYSTFSMCRNLIRQTPVRADSRDDLRDKLDRAAGGVIFTTIQKFAPADGDDYPAISERNNIIVMADEAHRSQYGFKARIDRKTGIRSYGHAKYLRDGLPHASFIGFTGTPIEASDVNTPAVFGNYVDIYDISRAVEDGATVPIYYESRLARIELPDEAIPELDDEIAELTEEEETAEQEKLKARWAAVERLVGSKQRLQMVAADLVEHLERRLEAMDGKAMAVCMSRRICVALYDEIIALRPDWHSDDDREGAVKVVMTGSASDPEVWQQHIGGKARRDELVRRAKAPDDPLRLILVRDMWLTGFDAPSMHTMYIDKPMRGHGLMQAIARVNRVFRDKEAGLVVDYIGIAQNLKAALGVYSASDQEQTGIDEALAVRVLLEKFHIVKTMFEGFDCEPGISGTPAQRLKCLAEGLQWVLAAQERRALKQASDDARKAEHRRFQDSVLALGKAFALAAASDEAKSIRDEVAFYQTMRAALAKTSTSSRSAREREFAVQQLIDKSVVSTEIVDILGAAGLETPDISILSDEFLAEMKDSERPNLALEALKKLLSDKIKSRAQTHTVESRRYSQRLADAIARYHTNAISTVEVIQALIELAKEIRERMSAGGDEGLSQEEMAFYEALAENESAIDVMGNDSLKVIAAELVNSLRSNATVDWARRESARARMRVLVKRILRKYGYPPDLQDDAVNTVLEQAELLAAQWQ